MRFKQKDKQMNAKLSFNLMKPKDKINGSGSLRSTLLKLKNLRQLSLQGQKFQLQGSAEYKNQEQCHNQKQGFGLQDKRYNISFFNDTIHTSSHKQNQKVNLQIQPHKTAFKEFIIKVQKYNQQRKEADKKEQKKQQNDVQAQKNNFTKYQENNQLKNCKQLLKQRMLAQKSVQNQPFLRISSKNQFYNKDQRSVTQNKQPQCKQPLQNQQKNLIIHQNRNKNTIFFGRFFKRAKTQQQIRFHTLDQTKNYFYPLQNNKSQTVSHKYITQIIQKRDKILSKQQQKQKTSLNISMNKTSTLKFQYPKNQNRNIIKHISMKLMQKQKNKQIIKPYNYLQRQKTEDLTLNKSIKQQDSINIISHASKKLLKTKFTKMRIRFGSSLYSKNISTIQQSQVKKQKYKSPFKTISAENIFKHRKYIQNTNSYYCENKIIQAQEAFIQKRRLIPTSQNKKRQQISALKTQFYTAFNQEQKHRNKFNRKISTQKNYNQAHKKHQNALNGWQSFIQQQTASPKIQQFY